MPGANRSSPAVAIADMDRDGDPDLVAGGAMTAFIAYTNLGNSPLPNPALRLDLDDGLLVSDGAFLIEKHKYLWKIAKTKGPKAPKEAHLKDPWAERARNAVAAFQKKPKANATTPKGPGAPSPKS